MVKDDWGADPAVRVGRKLRLTAGLFEFVLRVKTEQVLRREPWLGRREAQKRAYGMIDRAAR